MMNRFSPSTIAYCCSILLVATIFSSTSVVAQTCPPTNFDSMANFDFDGYIEDRWYSMKQLEVIYQPITQFYCVYADYEKISTKSVWCWIFGCTDPPSITVFNSARRQSVDGRITSIKFEGTLTGESSSKAKVSPRFIPRSLRNGSNYWVVTAGKWAALPNVADPTPSALKYDWAIITTGEPTSVGADEGCYSDGGMWIFSSRSIAPANAVDEIEKIAKGLGLSTSEWKPVAQEGCEYEE